METILLTGGAGYIGSHVILDLLEADKKVVVIDNLSTGRAYLIPQGVDFYRGDFADTHILDKIFSDHAIDSVMHFAGLIDANESIKKPVEYRFENTEKTKIFLEYCEAKGVQKFLFSSSAAVYGNPLNPNVTEDTLCAPLTPYGSSKLMAESVILDLANTSKMRCGILRYFNVVGADPQGRAGQPNDLASNLFSTLCRVVLGQQRQFIVYGTDYDTPDGSCIRDFIHVADLARAHHLLLKQLKKEQGPLVLNCGYGHGHSILEVVRACEKVIGKPVPHVIGPRREGDIEQSVANVDKLNATIPWQPRFDNLEDMITSALKWERRKSELQSSLTSIAS